MKINRFRSTPPMPRYFPVPAKVHATPRRDSFWRRFKRQFWAKKEQLATEFAIAGGLYMLCRLALHFVVSARVSQLLALGSIAAMLMMASGLMLTLDSKKDERKTKE